MPTVAVVQARIGSTRLPGKVLLPLGESYVLDHVVRQVRAADAVDEVVVATPDTEADDVVTFYAERSGAATHRGPEDDVLGRLFAAADARDADTVVRVSADNPLMPPAYVEHAVSHLQANDLDYVTPAFDRQFPPGLACEAMTLDSLRTVADRATTPDQREHVTVYYRDNSDAFDCATLVPADVPGCELVADRDDLRFTLDRAPDYELVRRVYENVPFDDVLSLEEGVRYVDENGLTAINRDVRQREV